jgi:hypothetical protein
MDAEPARRMLVAVGVSPDVLNWRESAVKDADPSESIDAPPVVELLSQPWPVVEGGLPQGQAITPASPGLQNVTGVVRPPSMTTASRNTPPALFEGSRDAKVRRVLDPVALNTIAPESDQS